MKSVYFANKVLNSYRNNMYLAMFDKSPEEGGMQLNNVRPKVEFSTPQDGVMSNTAKVECQTTNQNLNTARWIVFYDSATGGNVLLSFVLGSPISFNSSAPISFSEKSIVIKEG